MCNRLIPCTYKYDFVTEEQFAFRDGKYTELALLNIFKSMLVNQSHDGNTTFPWKLHSTIM
jgi:hypothetical protein